MADVEVGTTPPEEQPKEMDNVIVVEDLSGYGGTIEEKIDAFIEQHPVAVISKTRCPFCLDVKDLLGNVLGVTVHVIEVNTNPDGAKIQK